uniref:Ribosomal protein S1 n=1 Tax=Pyramimonas parkeae TaxID=36894 RepID=A0A1D8I1V5_9CHLO|nr:ribosomal protein S1 [Pyramimonas parkeae]YP_009310493.1 ribosomal protein S1 [Pyramimonas parkeae]AOT98964.1 ribosomal protein S1 [Pyramimonas parkeae]AOT98965.1 ribosomal protein S1 [Pyramimonas parkeae]
MINKKMKKYQGLFHLKNLPDLVIVVDPSINYAAIKEAKKMQIPVLAFIDIETPRIEEVDYWIPISNRSTQSIYQFFKIFVNLNK